MLADLAQIEELVKKEHNLYPPLRVLGRWANSKLLQATRQQGGDPDEIQAWEPFWKGVRALEKYLGRE